MRPQIALSEPLADLCRSVCGRCVPDSAVLFDDVAAMPSIEIRKRLFNLPWPRCGRCQFLLLMEAIEHLIPADELADWLSRPNADLDGCRPGDCIEAGDYDPVFTALFLLDPCGPVS